MCSTCASTRSLEYVLDCMPQLTWQCSTDTGDVYYANNGWKNYTGLPSYLTYSQWHTIVHPDDVEVAVKEWERCCKNKVPSSLAYRLRNICDGEYKWHQVSYHYDVDNNVAWWVGYGTDIPLATSLNVSVREVEEMYWRVVEAAAYPIITIDAEGIVITFNQAAQDMFQYTKGDILGKPFSEIIDIHGAVAEATSTTVQVAAKKRDGTYIPVSLSVGQFQQFGRQLYVLMFHEAESELKLQQELHRSKDNFLRNMSHELRTPLFGLLGTMSTMLVPEDPSLQMELKHMEDCTWRLLSVVNNMIDFYKLENLIIAPLPLPFNPRDMIADLCTSHHICVNEGVNFTFQVIDAVPQVLVSDVNFLKHTISNLLSNSLRFTQQGSVHALITVETTDQSDRLMFNFTLNDTGIGIAYDFFPKMFQPFSQMDSSDSRKYGGVGLGLAVSKRLVDLLGGSITFRSTLGEGSEFKVSVPVDLPQEGASTVLYEASLNLLPSPSSSSTESPAPSPPHTPTSSSSPTFKGTRPSLLSPISFSHHHSSGSESCSCSRTRSPSSPLSHGFRPAFCSDSTASTSTSSSSSSSLVHASLAFSPTSSSSNSPFCSPTSSPPCSPTSSSSSSSVMRALTSVSPISCILPESSSSAASLIFQPASTRPSFFLEMKGKASHLCPTDRPCPLCVSARWPSQPPTASHAPRVLFPSSHGFSFNSPSSRRTIAAHRMSRLNSSSSSNAQTPPLALKSSLDSQLTALEPEVASFLNGYAAARRPSSTPAPLPTIFSSKLSASSSSMQPIKESASLEMESTLNPATIPLPTSPPPTPLLLKMSRAVSAPAVSSTAPTTTITATATTTTTSGGSTEDDHEEDAEVAKVIEAFKYASQLEDSTATKDEPQSPTKPLRICATFPPTIPKLAIPASPLRASTALTTPPSTPPRNTTPRTPTTPKTPTLAPKTPTTPRTPTKHRGSLVASGPLAILANLFAQTSPSKASVTISSPSLFSSTSSLTTSGSTMSPSPWGSQVVSISPDSPCSFYAPLVPDSTSPPKSSNALSRVTSLPSLSKSHSHIRPQSPSSPANTLSPLLSFVPVSRTTSYPSLASFLQKPDPSSPSPPSSPSTPHSPSSPPTPSSPSLGDSTIVVNDNPNSISPRRLHSSLNTLLIPSPSSSLPSPDRSCYNVRSHQIRSSGPIAIAHHQPSPPASPSISPTLSPFSPRLHSSEHLPPSFPSSFSPPYQGFHSLSSSPSFSSLSSSPNLLRGSPLSVASSPTSVSSSPSSFSYCSGSSPSPVSTSPALSLFHPNPPSPASSSPIMLSSSSPPSPTPPITSNYGVTPGLRILVVEDNLLNQNIIKKMLERVGCEVVLAINGREALDILYAETHEKFIGYTKFHMVFMDCQMPVLDGYKATRRIRKQERAVTGQHIRIVAVTASSHAEDERKCLASGMDGFIAKPVSAQTLYNAIIQSP